MRMGVVNKRFFSFPILVGILGKKSNSEVKVHFVKQCWHCML